jgi:A/G-specific adenine glycosylase
MNISSGKMSNQKIRAALLRWYRVHRRDLPWRKTRDPYAIWVSEIMLQQTRVVAVIEYYEKFMRLFPTVATLAAAKEENVLAAWSGLGYYRRARSLHAAARKIVDELEGRVPATSTALRELPGVGRYTAAAIASIAYDEPVAVVDGNVERVLQRLDGVERTGEFVWERAQELLAPKSAGDWNQAMMELGATICTPATPVCDACPVQAWCKLPGHDVRKAQPARKKRELICGLAIRKDRVYLVQRDKGESLMASMWELPTLGTSAGVDVLARMKHSITNSDYTILVVKLDGRAVPKGGKWVPVAELSRVALTGIARKALRKAGVVQVESDFGIK